MKKLLLIFIVFFFASLSSYAQQGLINRATNVFWTEADNNTTAKNFPRTSSASVDITCEAGKFWTVDGNGAIVEWQLSGASITLLDTLFPYSPVNALAYCNLLDTGTIPTTLYGSAADNISYWSGTEWNTINTTPYYLNAGGRGRFLYYMQSDDQTITRYDGTNFTNIITLQGTFFGIAGIAVDNSGNVWSMISQSLSPVSRTDSLITIDSSGNIIHTYVLNQPIYNYNAYGCFMMDSTLYIGLGSQNVPYPNTLLPITISGGNAVVGAAIPFVNGYFLDLASCSSLISPPVADLAAISTTICANDCISFTDKSTNNPTSWHWSFAGGSPSTSNVQNPPYICYQTAGTYNVTLIAANAAGSDSITFSNFINVVSAPPTPVITQRHDTLFCSTDPTYTSYQWFDSSAIISGATDTFLVVSHGGNYNLEVSNENGCNAAVGVNITVGIHEYNSGYIIGYVSLYPNPVLDKLSVTAYSLIGKNTLTISDILGKEIYKQQLETLNFKLQTDVDVSNFTKGVYFVQIENIQDKWVGKFVKE